MAEDLALQPRERKGRPKYWEQNGKDGEKGRIRVRTHAARLSYRSYGRYWLQFFAFQLKRKRANGSPVYITLPHGPDSETFPDLCTAEPVLDLLDQVLKVCTLRS